MSSRESCPTCRGEAVVRWVGWHFLELVALGVPLALAATVSPWWSLVTLTVGTAWILHELRVSRRRRESQSSPDAPRPLPAAEADSADTGDSDRRGKGVSA